MFAYRYCPLVILCLCLSVFTTGKSFSADVREYYKQLDIISADKDKEKAVELLAILDNSNIWNFGAGLGPTDNRHIQISLLRVLTGFLPDQPFSSERRETDTLEKLRWKKLLSVQPDNTEALTQMLRDENPAVRWLGLHKAGGSDDTNPLLAEMLVSIAKSDDYIIISRTAAEWSGNTPPPPGWTKNDFTAPLRELANDILVRRNRKHPSVSETDLYEHGVSQLTEYYKKHRKDVLYAIFSLDKKSMARHVIRNLSAQKRSKGSTSEKKMAEEFVRALNSDIYGGSF